MITVNRDEGNFVALTLSGKVDDADFQKLMPVLDGASEKGDLHLLLTLDNFQGWDKGALWEAMKVDESLASNVGVVAIVGDSNLSGWMKQLTRPFMSSQIQYFNPDEKQDAMEWVQDGL